MPRFSNFVKVYSVMVLMLLLISFNRVVAEDLLQIVDIAFKNNYEYKSVVDNFNANYAFKSIAKSYILPRLNLEGNAQISNDRRTYSEKVSANFKHNGSESHVLSVSVAQPLYNKNAFSQYSKANLLAEQAQIDLDRGKNNIIIKVAQYYFDVLSSQDNLEYATAKMKYLENYMKETIRKSEVGQGRRIDIEEVRARYEQAKYESILASNDLEVKIDVLNKFLNYRVVSYKKIIENLQDLELKNQKMEGWIDSARRNNLDILYSQISVLIGDEDISIASAGYYPTLLFLGSVGISGGRDVIIGDRYNGSSAKVGLSLNINLFEGGATKNLRKQAEDRKSSIKYVLMQLENNVANLSRQYYLNVKNGFSQIEALKQAKMSSEKFLEAAKQSYSVGLKTTTDVLIATEDYFKASRNYSKSKYEFLLSILALKAVSGRLSEQDIIDINRYLY